MARVVLFLMFVTIVGACRAREPELTGAFKVDGSSTMFPLTSAAVRAFAKPHPAVQVSVAISGTGGGFRTFCRGDVEMQDASRPINATERAACDVQAGVGFVELPVAQDALTIVVHPSNDWVKSLSIAELRKLWEPSAQGGVMRWSDIKSGWPTEPIHLFAPDAESGTFDFFTETVVGTLDALRRDFTATADDTVIVTSVGNDRFALGYVGYGYFEQHKATLRAVAIEGPNADRFGAVLPTQEPRRGAYAPLARTLLLYVNTRALDRPEVSRFVDFYIDQAEALTQSVRGIVLSPRSYELVKQRVSSASAAPYSLTDVPVTTSSEC